MIINGLITEENFGKATDSQLIDFGRRKITSVWAEMFKRNGESHSDKRAHAIGIIEDIERNLYALEELLDPLEHDNF